jgi:DNA uptake protein ComE-like DNA-binding protein
VRDGRCYARPVFVYSRSSWGRVLGLACLVAFMVVGPYRIMEFLYQMGLYPAVSEKKVVAALLGMRGVEGVACQKKVAGWDYVCEYVRRDSSGTVSRHRDGIRTSWLTPITSMTPLPIDGPTPSPDEQARRVKNEYRKLLEPVNLRTATVTELQRVPLVDKYLAEQIYAGVRAGTITRVDDLSKINGIDQPRFSVIRPRVRWE